MKKTTSGFTIVELLIVIVVIAILATISIVTYRGIQARAYNSSVRQGASQVVKALANWSTLTGKSSPTGGYSSTLPLDSNGVCPDGTGMGWIATGAGYSCSLEEQLVYHNLLPQNFMRGLPPNSHMGASTGIATLMIYPCVSADNTWALVYHLRSPSADDIASYDALIARCPSGDLGTIRTAYGMHGGTVVSLR